MLTFDAQQALGFLVSQKTHVEAQAYEIQYPDIQYPELIPVDTSANEWAKSVTFFSMNKVGQAAWFHHSAKDIPRADVEMAKLEHGIEMAGIGYGYSLEEIGQAMMVPGTNLTADRAGAAIRGYEEFVDGRAMVGDPDKGWTGLLNDANVARIDVQADGAGGGGNSPLWTNKSPDQVARDINAALSGVHTASLTVEIADTVLLPVDDWLAIATRRMADGNDKTILTFVQENNVYTARTGRPITIRGVRGLETAGAEGVGRMIVYRRDPQVLKLHLPMPHRFLPVWQTGPIWFDVPGIFRFGGVEIRRPGAMRYVDGISGAGGEGEGEG